MWWYRALHDRFVDRLRYLRLEPGAKILDAGCGTGGLLLRLTHDLPELDYAGLDYDAAAVKMTEDKTGATVHCGTVNALPFPADHFEAILSADVLCHAQVDEAVAMAELLRCLRPGRSLLLNLPAYNWMKSSHDRHVHNVRRYTTASVRRIAERHRLPNRGRSATGTVCCFHCLLLVPALRLGRRGTQSDVRPFPLWQDRALLCHHRRRAEVGQPRLSTPVRSLSLDVGGEAVSPGRGCSSTDP